MEGAPIDITTAPDAPSDYYVTVAEAARRSGRKPKTLLNWIYTGKLGSCQGLCRIMGEPIIHWATFEAAMIKRV